MKTILVPTDFSKNALNAVKYAYAFGEATKSKIILYHAFVNPTSELNIPMADIHFGRQEARDVAEANMAKLISTLSKTFPDIHPKWIVEPGTDSDNISAYVKQNNIPLIIMGTTGQGAIGKVFIGSTTSRVISNVASNIIAIPPTSKFKGVQNIVFAIDLDTDNLSAACESVNFAQQFKAKVTFLYVEDLAIFDADKFLGEMLDKIIKRTKYKNVSFIVENNSSIANALEGYIKKNKPDMLTMATHSRKFPETIWKRSWTNKMSNLISIPLLVLHIHKSETQDTTDKINKASVLPH